MQSEGGKMKATWLVALSLLAGALLWPAATEPAYQGSVLRFSDLPEIESLQVKSRFFGYNSGVKREKTSGEPAYDYSVHIIKEGGRYRMYSGARWRRVGVTHGDGDHVIQHISKTGLGGSWRMPRNQPEFWQGNEEGHSNTWFSNNYMDPEVLKVKGIYYMYTQVEIDPESPIDLPGQMAVTQCDRIQLHTSRDGSHWSRWSKARGVVINLDDPTHTNLHHHEMIYVPWDRDKKPFWMYVVVNINGQHTGHWRIRSNDPTTYDWKQREVTAGISQLGNQIGYARQAPGGPLFVRITFTGDGEGRTVPTLQFSRDGLNWFWGDEGPVKLAGSEDQQQNKNCYFLGISTVDGIGQLEYLGRNTYRAIYGATTSNAPGGMPIFWSDIGVGELVFTIQKKAV